MSRIVRRLWAGALCLCVLQGCAHFVETKAIERFSTAMQEKDLPALQKAVTDDFSRRALRLDESVDDLKILRLPSGKMEVTQVETVSDTEKLVAASPENSKRKVHYRLTKAKGGSWLIDDVLISQKRDGLTSTKSVSEQMDLLATVREFITAWDAGQRQAALEIATPEFAQSISSLPPGYFETLAERITGERASSSKIRPQAQIGEEFAIVRVRRPTGEMVLSFELQNNLWRISDVAVEGSGDREHVPSVRKMASVVRTSFEFLEAYSRADKDALSRVCDEQLFRRSLSAADLAAVTLPDVSAADGEYNVSIHGQRAFFEVPGETAIVRIDLVGHQDEDNVEAATTYAIEEVTVYELQGDKQEKRLSAFFTAHATLRLFHRALRERNLPVLAKLATTQFNERVWSRLNESTLALLQLPAIGPQPQIVGTSFHGALTQLDVNDNGSPMIVVLRDQGGELRVDDIHVPAEGRSSSMRDTWDLTIAVLEFREGMRTADIGRLQRHSSRNLTGLVWKHVDSIPPLGHVATRHLGAPLSGLRFDGQHALLTLGDEQFGAKVKMVKEHGYYVIDNIELIAGVEPQQRLAFKESVRRQIVMRGPTHQHVSHAQAVEPRPQSGVVNADWVEPAEMPRGNATPLGAEPTFQPR